MRHKMVSLCYETSFIGTYSYHQHTHYKCVILLRTSRFDDKKEAACSGPDVMAISFTG